MNPSRASIATTVLIVGLLLAGCTGSPGPEPSTTPTAEPSTAPEPDPTAPRSALPLTCEELYGLDDLQPLLETPVQVRRDETSAPLGVRGAAFAQMGTLECVFGGEGRTGSSYDQGLALQVVPNGAQWFDASVVEMGSSPLFNTLGERSMLYCSGNDAGGTGWRCSTALLVGDYLLRVRASDSAGRTTTEATALITGVVEELAGRIAAAPPARALWTPPESADGAVLCSDQPSLTALTGQPAGGILGNLPELNQYPGASACTVSYASTTVDIGTLQGGAWAFDAVAASPDLIFHPWLRPGTRYDVPGTDGAIITCLDQCNALVSWRGTLVQLAFDEPSYDPDVAADRVRLWAAALPVA